MWEKPYGRYSDIITLNTPPKSLINAEIVILQYKNWDKSIVFIKRKKLNKNGMYEFDNAPPGKSNTRFSDALKLIKDMVS